MRKVAVKERKYAVGEIVKLNVFNSHFPQPHGIVVGSDGYFYQVKWFDSYQEDGGYVWASLDKI